MVLTEIEEKETKISEVSKVVDTKLNFQRTMRMLVVLAVSTSPTRSTMQIRPSSKLKVVPIQTDINLNTATEAAEVVGPTFRSHDTSD